jgi:hypothetical protein
MKPLFTLVLAALMGLSVHSHLISGNIDSTPSYLMPLDKHARGLDFSTLKVVLNGGQYTGFVDSYGAFSV